ncbi:MAG: hypothetical protein IH945_04410 [Armatimonadetes bacterium]|nr:hypothetical protein [Armatimonadota bacterium]
MDAYEVFKTVLMTLGVLVIPAVVYAAKQYSDMRLLRSAVKRGHERLDKVDERFDTLHELKEEFAGVKAEIGELRRAIEDLKR